MKALTVLQPWASLIALGAKRIETRSWRTYHRGDLAIHAGKSSRAWRELDAPHLASERQTIQAVLRAFGAFTTPDEKTWRSPIEFDSAIWFSGWHDKPAMPLGAVVAIANLVDVIPIIGRADPPRPPYIIDLPKDGRYAAGMWVIGHNALTGGKPTRLTDEEVAFGDYSPGRFAWILDDVKSLQAHELEPVPLKGKQGLWNWDWDGSEKS